MSNLSSPYLGARRRARTRSGRCKPQRIAQSQPQPPSFFAQYHTREACDIRPGFCAGSFARPALQSIALFLIIVISMMAMVKPAHASGTVQITPWEYHCWLVRKNWLTWLYDPVARFSGTTRYAACEAACASIGSALTSQWSYSCTTWGYQTVDDISGGTCPPNTTVIYGPTTTCACNAPYVPDPTSTRCVLPTCPDHAHGTPCACDTGYKFDAAGTSCVPAPTCTFTKVADITDPVAKLYENGTYSSKKPDMEHLTLATQVGLACIQQKVAVLNCNMTPQPSSGYRPTAYQTHLLEVYDKWQEIKDNNAPECAETKAAIEKEFEAHRPFARRPGVTSNHSQLDALGNPAGNAVDISFVPDDANNSADAIACQCNMYRPLINMPNPKDNDPVHYQPRTCPR